MRKNLREKSKVPRETRIVTKKPNTTMTYVTRYALNYYLIRHFFVAAGFIYCCHFAAAFCTV